MASAPGLLGFLLASSAEPDKSFLRQGYLWCPTTGPRAPLTSPPSAPAAPYLLPLWAAWLLTPFLFDLTPPSLHVLLRSSSSHPKSLPSYVNDQTPTAASLMWHPDSCHP